MKQATKTIIFSLLTALSASLAAAPDGYSINSDSGSAFSDSLYRIDLSSGQQTRLGFVRSLGQTRLDVEGLAFALDGTLYGVDDESLKLFPLNTDNGQVINSAEVSITGLPGAGGNDFGMTFACDGNLYVTSASDDSLYRVALTGQATRIGNAGSLGTNINSLAAWGNPVELYGLGDGGLNGGGPASLYSLNLADGTKTLKGQLGGGVALYDQAGLAFDSSGQLWAITDRSQLLTPLPSQILQVNKSDGTATLVSSTIGETGFESLAITLPRGCGGGGGEDRATFTVQSRFVDHNNIAPVTLDISCNTGLILDQTKTVLPNEGLNGAFEVSFVVSDFGSNPLNCSVSQRANSGYNNSYTCLGESECVAAQSITNCSFNNVIPGSDNLCQVQSYPNAVPFTVIKEWLFEAEDIGETDFANIKFECANVYDGDGVANGNSMNWSWDVHGNSQRIASIQPKFNGSTQCRATESNTFSAVEAENGCANWLPVLIGDISRTCTISNTVFLEGIPTLSDYGRWLMVLLLLGVGLVAVRRI
ncbi:MAG: IPTL-CTERM sorting domain-containing protein [Xanthomonadales bacterium]|nr:IPTL-CTERM sorting domain-containing protein [Xanthomonadales bacterium]